MLLLIQGMNDAGVDVYNIGLCGTEMMLLPATFYYGLDGGFMITASHNPAILMELDIRGKKIPVAQIPVLRILKSCCFSSEFENCAEKDMFIQKKL